MLSSSPLSQDSGFMNTDYRTGMLGTEDTDASRPWRMSETNLFSADTVRKEMEASTSVCDALTVDSTLNGPKRRGAIRSGAISDGPRAYTCTQCDESFQASHQLEHHGKITSHRTYVCTEQACSKSYSRRDVYVRHMATHSERHIHECTLCAAAGNHKVFKRKDHLTQHIRNCHAKHAHRPHALPMEGTASHETLPLLATQTSSSGNDSDGNPLFLQGHTSGAASATHEVLSTMSRRPVASSHSQGPKHADTSTPAAPFRAWPFVSGDRQSSSASSAGWFDSADSQVQPRPTDHHPGGAPKTHGHHSNAIFHAAASSERIVSAILTILGREHLAFRQLEEQLGLQAQCSIYQLTLGLTRFAEGGNDHAGSTAPILEGHAAEDQLSSIASKPETPDVVHIEVIDLTSSPESSGSFDDDAVSEVPW